MKINRRHFFVKTFQSAVILSIPAIIGPFLESCSKSSNPVGSGSTSSLSQIQGNISGNIVTVTVDS